MTPFVFAISESNIGEHNTGSYIIEQVFRQYVRDFPCDGHSGHTCTGWTTGGKRIRETIAGFRNP
jgi:hypothetical protein